MPDSIYPESPHVDGPRVDRAVGELSPSQNAPGSINPAPRVDGPHVDRAANEVPPSQKMPAPMGIASIGQSMNYHPNRTCRVLSTPLFHARMDIVSIGQSMNYHHRKT